MSNDISHIPDFPGKGEIQKALTLRGKVEALIERSKPLLEARRPEQARPGRRASELAFDPERTLLNKYQGNLYYASIFDGIYGLARIATDHVKKRMAEVSDPNNDPEAARKPFRHLLDDFEDGYKKMCWLIVSMHRDVLESLIRGNLISREREDTNFRARTADSTRLHALPSIYLLQIVNVEFVKGQRTPYPGRGLNWREWKETLGALTQYLDESEEGDNGAGSWVDQVDGSFIDRDRRKWQAGQRCRYLANERQKDVLREFIKAAQEMYVVKGQALYDVNPSDPALDVAMARVPQECGWGLSGIERASQHSTAGQFSNSLFSLFHCVLRELWGRERWEVASRKLVDVTRPLDAPVAEYLCSELGQTYWYQGGLNPAYAGTMMMSGKKRALTGEDYEHLWPETLEVLRGLDCVEENLAYYKKVRDDNRRFIDEDRKCSIDQRWDEIEKAQSLLKAELDHIQERAEANVLTRHKEGIDDWVRRNDEYQKSQAAAAADA